jgi:autotransporter adhesin
VSTATGSGSVSIGNGATAANANDIALGSGSQTSTAVQTANMVIGGTTYSFAGTTPTSTVSVGTVGNERTITNVAAGRVSNGSTDAINGSQLFAATSAIDSLSTVVSNGLTHYYGVNDGGTQQANYTNNGATGTNSMAAGIAASASTPRPRSPTASRSARARSPTARSRRLPASSAAPSSRTTPPISRCWARCRSAMRRAIARSPMSPTAPSRATPSPCGS